MLLPNNIQPELSVYYNGALILKSLKEKNIQSLIELLLNVKKDNEITLPILVLSLDWLYLLDVIKINENGEVVLCT